MKLDNQKPTFEQGFLKVTGDGDFAIEMGEKYGYSCDPWQRDLIRQIFNDNVYRIGFSAPRQNGKNGILELVELYAPMIRGSRILHTSHQMQTSIEQFSRLEKRWFNNPNYRLLKDHSEVSYGRGSEEIRIDNGGRIMFTTRSAVRGRGFSVDILILDESQEMTEEEWAALSPTLTASPDALIILTGTPPVSTRQGQGIVFQNFRKKAYKGELNKGEIYAEWGINDLEKEEVFDEKTWIRVNPAWQYRVNKNVIRANSLVMDKESFAREHLGYWYKGDHNTIYKSEMWEDGLIDQRPNKDQIDRYAVGIVYSQDGEMWCSAMGAVLTDGSLYAELIDLSTTKKGTGQILQICKNMYENVQGFTGVIAHGKAGLGNLMGDAEMMDLFPLKLIEMCRYDSKMASHTLLDNTMKDGELKHIDQSQLKDSLLSLDKYLTNGKQGGFGFISRNGQLIASEAVALALYWAKNNKPKSKRSKQSIW